VFFLRCCSLVVFFFYAEKIRSLFLSLNFRFSSCTKISVRVRLVPDLVFGAPDPISIRFLRVDQKRCSCFLFRFPDLGSCFSPSGFCRRYFSFLLIFPCQGRRACKGFPFSRFSFCLSSLTVGLSLTHEVLISAAGVSSSLNCVYTVARRQG
jgi:hypothetical protein